MSSLLMSQNLDSHNDIHIGRNLANPYPLSKNPSKPPDHRRPQRLPDLQEPSRLVDLSVQLTIMHLSE